MKVLGTHSCLPLVTVFPFLSSLTREFYSFKKIFIILLVKLYVLVFVGMHTCIVCVRVCVCVNVWVYAHECRCVRKPESASLELESQVAVISILWVLETELRSSAKAMCALHF